MTTDELILALAAFPRGTEVKVWATCTWCGQNQLRTLEIPHIKMDFDEAAVVISPPNIDNHDRA